MESENKKNIDCCFICKNFNIGELLGYTFNDKEIDNWIVCEFYPEQLPKTPDILEVYICANFERIDPKVFLPKGKKLFHMFSV